MQPGGNQTLLNLDELVANLRYTRVAFCFVCDARHCEGLMLRCYFLADNPAANQLFQLANPLMLEAINLTCVRGTRRLFKDLNFTVERGELIELRGPNGSGKTSLLRILCGLATPASGDVLWDGKNIRALREEYSAVVAYLGHQNAVKDELSAIENLRIASGVSG